MGNTKVYKIGFAVLRVDHFKLESHVSEVEIDGVVQPAPGPDSIKVKEVVFDAEVARREVDRLNRLNKNRDCRYYWQTTHVFGTGDSQGQADGPDG